MSRHLATASNELEAQMVLSLVRGAGIQAWASSSLGGEGVRGPCDIYVDDADLERAQQALADAGDVDEDELADLAQRQPPPT
jgi:Putative prokaryotic signal transducing protein